MNLRVELPYCAGAIITFETTLNIDGITSFTGNSAESKGGMTESGLHVSPSMITPRAQFSLARQAQTCLCKKYVGKIEVCPDTIWRNADVSNGEKYRTVG